MKILDGITNAQGWIVRKWKEVDTIENFGTQKKILGIRLPPSTFFQGCFFRLTQKFLKYSPIAICILLY